MNLRIDDPPLPPLDRTQVLGYSAIRYASGWPEFYVQQYAREYAEAVLEARYAYWIRHARAMARDVVRLEARVEELERRL